MAYRPNWALAHPQMTKEEIFNVNILAESPLPTPREISAELPMSPAVEDTVIRHRRAIQDILDGRDPRLFLVVGPCSIHDVDAALDYATRLRKLAAEVEDTFLIIMRVYFTKPRTSVGWKGLINDPFLDDSFHIEKGLRIARKLLLEISELGLAAGTEALDSTVPQYIGDLITWTAIGARTTESQTHREMASGLSTPVGFKNATDGNIQVAINALRSVSRPHHFLGVNQDGVGAVLETRGNSYGHIVLRGGAQPNYDSVNVAMAEAELQTAGLPVNIMVDCSHGNSLKNHNLQPLVFDNCINQILEGNGSIVGMMVESNIHAGNQPLQGSLKDLKYGVSITDACIDWAATESMIRKGREKIAGVMRKRSRVVQLASAPR